MTNPRAAFVGSIPQNYHRYLGPMVFQPFAEDLAARMPVAPGARVLEIACGTGILTEQLLRRLAGGGAVVATDLNDAMFAHARPRLPADGLIWRQADGAHLPFPDGAFDAAACQFGLMFFRDKPAGIREASRVLKPGGWYGFNVWDAIDRNPIQRITHETVAKFFPKDPPQFYLVPCSLSNPAPIRTWLEWAGFVDVNVETVDKVGTTTSWDDAARGLIDGNPISTEIMTRRPAMLPEIRAAVAKNLAAALRDPRRCPLRAHVFTARRP